MEENTKQSNWVHKLLITLAIFMVIGLFLEFSKDGIKMYSACSMRQEYKEDNIDGFVPAINMTETVDEYIVTADIPGVEKDAIDISLNGNILTIKGERSFGKEEKKEDSYYYHERKSGYFEREILLPEVIDQDTIKAEHKNGIIYITLPKKKQSEKIKKVQII